MGHGFEFKKESYEHDHHSSGHGHGYGYGHATSRPSHHYGNSVMPVGQGYHHQAGGYSTTQNFPGHNNKHNQYLGHNNGNNHGFLGQTMPMPCPPNGNMGWSNSNHGGQFNNPMRHGGGGGGGGGFFEKKEYEESRWSSGHGGGRMAGSNTMMHGGGGGGGGGYTSAEWVSKGL